VGRAGFGSDALLALRCLALSTAEAEYSSASESAAGVDALYLRNPLERLGFAHKDPAQVF
jgi:hypothetical protein